jgi:hypothetical protein
LALFTIFYKIRTKGENEYKLLLDFVETDLGFFKVEDKGFQSLLQNVGQIFTSNVGGLKFKTPAVYFGFTQKDHNFSLFFCMGEITTNINSYFTWNYG